MNSNPQLNFYLTSAAIAVVAGLAPAAMGQPALQVEVNSVIVPHNGVANVGNSAVGEKLDVTVRLRNTGDATLNVSSVTLSGQNAAEFATSLLSANLGPDMTAIGTLSFTPATTGIRQATMLLSNNGGQNPFVILLAGTGRLDPAIDCNENNVPDADDLAAGTSEDCDADGTPDECQLDTDGDGVIDACDPDPNGTTGPRCGSGVVSLAPLLLLSLLGVRRTTRRGPGGSPRETGTTERAHLIR